MVAVWVDRAGMDRQLPGLGELGLPYRQHSALKIDIRMAQVNGLGDTHPGRGHQAKQGFVGEWSNRVMQNYFAPS